MTTRTFTPALSTSGIGSLPFSDPAQAAAFVHSCGLDVPFWPQLPKRTFGEQMIPQYAEGMPAVAIETVTQSIRYNEEAKYDELTAFYTQFLESPPDAFAISPDRAAGIPAFVNAAQGRTLRAVKGQITGPITFTTGILNARKDALYADPDLRDAAVKLLTRKAQWQIDILKPLSENVILFADEPVLAALGSSAYVGISDQDVINLLKEVFEAIREAGALSGIHVCGNSDWSVLIRTTVDILNFDAFQYGPRLALYHREVREFLEQGGIIAWGLVPTTADELNQATCESLSALFRAAVQALTTKGVPESLVLERSMLTPCCGCGSLDVVNTQRVFALLQTLRDTLR